MSSRVWASGRDRLVRSSQMPLKRDRSSAKLSRLETGQVAPNVRDVRDLLEMYDVSIEAQPWWSLRAARSNSPFFTPARNASHSSDVKLNRGPQWLRVLLSATTIVPSLSVDTATHPPPTQ